MSEFPNRKRYENLPVLVTGGAGFLGSHLIRALLDMGASVSCLQRPGSDLSRIEALRPRLSLCSVDLRDRAGVAEAVRKTSPYVVFHLAAYGVRPELNSSVDAYETNVLGWLNLLEAIDPLRVEAIVNTGTCFEYSGDKEGALSESEPTAATSPYAASKTAAIEIAKFYAKARGYPIVSLRPFTFFGPLEGPKRFIPSVIQACLKGEDVRLTGGRQTRDFLYVEDVVRAYLRAGTCPVAAGHVINIGSGRAAQVSQVAQEIVQVLEASSKLHAGALPYRPLEYWHLCADIRKARDLLGWSPEFSLKEGVLRTACWMKGTGL